MQIESSVASGYRKELGDAEHRRYPLEIVEIESGAGDFQDLTRPATAVRTRDRRAETSTSRNVMAMMSSMPVAV